jgi:hypothetical protein
MGDPVPYFGRNTAQMQNTLRSRMACGHRAKRFKGVKPGGSFTVGGWDHDCVGVDLGDAEVPAKVDEIEGAELARNLDDVHVAGGAAEDGNAGDVGAVEVKPQVGDGGVGLGGVGRGLVGVDEVFPSGDVKAVDDGGHGLGRVEGRMGIVIVVDRDTGEGGGRAVSIEATGEKKVLRDLQLGAVKAEGGMAGGLIGEVHQRALEVGWGSCGRLGDSDQCCGEQRGEQELLDTSSHLGLFPVRHGF